TQFPVGCLVLRNSDRKAALRNYYAALKNMVTEVKVSEKDMETDGSIMIVLAPDAPVKERQLHRIAKRCGTGLGRTGSNMANGSGDIVIAFTNNSTFQPHNEFIIEEMPQLLDDHAIMNVMFQAATEATNEAILNSITMAETKRGRNSRVVEGILDSKSNNV